MSGLPGVYPASFWRMAARRSGRMLAKLHTVAYGGGNSREGSHRFDHGYFVMHRANDYAYYHALAVEHWRKLYAKDL